MKLDRFLQPIKNKIMLLIGRGILTAITNSGKTQKIQITGFSGETLSNIIRMQPYGLETMPVIDNNTETLNVFYNGTRDLGFNIICHNRELRPTDLNDGDTCLWSKDSNDSNENRIIIKPTNNEIEIKTADGNSVVIDNTGIVIDDKNGNNITLDSNGAIIEDINSNKITMEPLQIKLENANNNILVGAASVRINGTNLEIYP